MQKKKIPFRIVAPALVLTLIAGLLFFAIDAAHFTRPDIQGGTSFPANSELLNVQKAIEHYRHEIRQDPQNIENYIRIARASMQQARITGGHHESYRSAQNYISEALKLNPDNLEAIATQAAIFLNYHQFEQAKAWAEKALELNDINAFTWGVYSDALKELGDYPAAVNACDKMLQLKPDIRSYSRASHLREVHGDISGALAAMKLAVNAGVIGTESHAWAAFQLGNLYLKSGHTDTAEIVFNKILETTVEYPHALEGLARIYRDGGDREVAEQYLLRAYRRLPEHSFMETLADLYRSNGDLVKADAIAQSVLEAYRQHETQGWNVGLEMATFLLTQKLQLDAVLTLTIREYRRRPRHRDVQFAHAWALYENDHKIESDVLLRQILRPGGFHAPALLLTGLRYYEQGDLEKASDCLRRSIENKSLVPPGLLQEARHTLAGLAAMQLTRR